MNFTPYFIFALLFFFICNLTAQRIEVAHVLQENGKTPISEKVIFRNIDSITFADDSEGERKLAHNDFIALHLRKRNTPYLTSTSTKMSRIKGATRKNTTTPTRISVTPTAFNLPKGQIYYRNSAMYINEFGFGAKYFHASIGWYFIQPMLRIQGNLPIKEFIHIGLALEGNFRNRFANSPLDFGGGRLSFSPVLTIGNTNYFVNVTYKSQAPLFLPINDIDDNSILRESVYWAFGGGLKIGRKFQYLTETMLIEDENQQKHLKVFNGVAGSFRRHTVGVGISIYDTEQTESNNSFLFANTGSIYLSVLYTVRFR